MGRLVQGVHRSEVRWSKFKSSYMWNSIYYRRRTKFVVYQLATTFIGAASGLGNSTLTGYTQRNYSTAKFPNAKVDNSAIVGSFAINTFANVFIALLFAAALFFDLFWPERTEIRGLQWTWKLGALLASLSQLAASIATTVVVFTLHAGVSGVPAGEESAFDKTWNADPLLYRKNTKAIICIALCWAGCLSALYSTFVMWDCYAHNNKFGPFAVGHHAKSKLLPSLETNPTCLDMESVGEGARENQSST